MKTEYTSEGNIKFKNIVLTPRTLEIIKIIQEGAGISGISETLAYCVYSVYKKDYKPKK